MGLFFVSTTALTPSSFTGYDASTFNIILIPSSQTVYNSLITAGFLSRNILFNSPSPISPVYTKPTDPEIEWM
jgi:hypothetical protein